MVPNLQCGKHHPIQIGQALQAKVQGSCEASRCEQVIPPGGVRGYMRGVPGQEKGGFP